MNTAVYLLNRLPTKALDFKTPYEVWHGVKPIVEHLKVFGSICHAHVSEMKKNKMDHKSEICIFVGYNNNTKGYRVFNVNNNKLVVSRDVKVDENFVWNWDKNEVQTLGENSIQGDEKTEEIILDDENAISIRGTRLLSDVYERCNLALSDPITFEGAN